MNNDLSRGGATQTAEPPSIPGYTYGMATVARSPVSLQDLESLKKVLLFTNDDVAQLRQSRDVLAGQIEAILDVWYGFVAATPELVVYFTDTRSGQPDAHYLAAVRQRFARWILDTAEARYDQAWLDYQHEIGLRHHRTKKNRTDDVTSADIIHLRYVLALTIPITTTLKPFLAKGGHAPEEVERMHAAWVKAVLLQVILWSYPYVRAGEF